jgi:feruloyl-CoA synthase
MKLGLQPSDRAELLNHPELRALCIGALKAHGLANPANSTRVDRAIILLEPLSLDRGEITDKGSVNQRAVLNCRDALVSDLYASEAPNHVLCVF